MESVTTEQAIKNQVASAKMEGFRFTKDDVELVRRCLENEITDKEFSVMLLSKYKRS